MYIRADVIPLAGLPRIITDLPALSGAATPAVQ